MPFAAAIVVASLLAFASPAFARLDEGTTDAPAAAPTIESLPEAMRPMAEQALAAMKLDQVKDVQKLKMALAAMSQQMANMPAEAKPLAEFLAARIQARIDELTPAEAPAAAPAETPAEPAAAAAAPAPEPIKPSASNQEALESFIHAALIGRPDVAKTAAEVILADGAPAAELATIVDQRGIGERLEKAVAATRGQPELYPVAMQVLQKVDAGRSSLARDPARIEAVIPQLKGSLRQQAYALRMLESAGAYAMPALTRALLESNDPQLELMAARAMTLIGRNAVMPLCAALPMLSGPQQIKVCGVLGDIGWKAAAPALVAVQASAESTPGAREAAGVVLRRMGVTATEPGPLWASLARACLTGGEGLLPYPSDAEQMTWSYRPDHGLMPKSVPTPAYLDVLAQHFAMNAMKLDSGDGAALATYLAAGLRLQSMGVDTGENFLAPADLVMVAGPSVAQQVLALAISIQDPGLQRGAIRTLASTGGASSLVQGGPSAPLVACLDSANQRVRVEAALAIARAMPTSSFARSDAVVPLLAGAVRSTGKPAAAVVAAQAEDRANFEQWLKGRGYEVLASEASATGLLGSMAGRGSAELVVVAGGAADVNGGARSLRNASSTGGALMVLAVQEADASAIDRSLRDDRSAEVWFLGGNADQFGAAVTGLQKRAGGGELAAGDAEAMAAQCADALITLGRSGGGAFRLADGQIALIDALNSQSGDMRAKVADALSWIPTQEAQRALLDAGLKDLKEGSTISPDEQKALLRAAAASARRFGDKADPAQIERLRMGFDAARSMGDFAKSPEARDLLAALSECYGSFNLGPQQSIKLILK